MDFYVDFFSELIKAQQGFVRSENDSAAKQKSTVLRDVCNQPERVISIVLDHFLHRINLIDVKGLKDFHEKNIEKLLVAIHTSLQSILKYTFLGHHQVFVNQDKD